MTLTNTGGLRGTSQGSTLACLPHIWWWPQEKSAVVTVVQAGTLRHCEVRSLRTLRPWAADLGPEPRETLPQCLAMLSSGGLCPGIPETTSFRSPRDCWPVQWPQGSGCLPLRYCFDPFSVALFVLGLIPGRMAESSQGSCWRQLPCCALKPPGLHKDPSLQGLLPAMPVPWGR